MNTNLATNTQTNWRLYAAKAKSPYEIAVGRAITLFREESKMSILQLSLNCGISSRRLGRIERGTEPISLSEVQLLAEALGFVSRD